MRPRRFANRESRLIKLLDRQAGRDADAFVSAPKGTRFEFNTEVSESVRIRKRFDSAMGASSIFGREAVRVTSNLRRAREDENYQIARKFPQFFCIHGKARVFKGHPLGCKKCS